MPEGPEIRLAADRVAKAVQDVPLVAVSFAFEHLGAYEEPLGASRVVEVETRGKTMLTHFSCGLSVYSHNQLYGRWMVGRADRYPNTRRSLRFAMVGRSEAARLYSASSIDVLDTTEVEADPRIAKLGPDPLHDTTTPAAIAARLLDGRFASRGLGGLLLDQGFVAGLGNYLRSDILNLARVHPSRRARALPADRIDALAEAIVTLPRRSYRTRGLTNDPARVAELRAAGKTRRQLRHVAYGRTGQPCYACGQAIVRSEHGGRSLFWCPRCQQAEGP